MIPRPQVNEVYCSSHLYTVIPTRASEERRLAVSSWYEGGLSVFDFSAAETAEPVPEPVDPDAVPITAREIGFYDPTGVDGRGETDVWTTYWYNDYIWSNDIERGFDVFAFCGLDPCEPQTDKSGALLEPKNLFRARHFHHMNAQTQETFQTLGP